MINIITERNHDPTEAFTNLWLNKDSGAIFVWSGKPVLIGYSKEGKLIVADVFEGEFVHTQVGNMQNYSVAYEYGKIPLIVLAMVESGDYTGSDVVISFGGEYGAVSADDKFVLVAQTGNMEIGKDVKMECHPESGRIHVTLTVISYG